MKLDIAEKIRIPEGVDVQIDDKIIRVNGSIGSNEKNVFHPRIKIEKKDEFILLSIKKGGKKEKTILNTFKAHIKNLLKGAEEGYECQLKVCSGHFPMNVSIQGDNLVIKNFFGEKKPRKVKLLDGANLKIEGDIITINGVDKDVVGSMASKIELTMRRSNYDKRIFQDGIWIIKKAK